MKWEYVKLGSICKTGAGGTPLKSRKAYYENGNIPWLRSGEVNNRNINNCEIKITQEGLDNSSAKLFPPGTVLIAMYGATAGQVGILNFSCSTNQAVCGILPNEYFIPEFLYYFFLSFKNNLIAQAVGNAQPNISQAKIKDTLVPTIAIEEQQQIVQILDQAFEKIDHAIANIEQNIKNAEELFQAKLNEVFSQKGEGWEEKKLSEITEVKDGTHDSPKYVSEGIPFVTQKNIIENKLVLENTKFITQEDHNKFYKRSNVTRNDLLIAMIGANRGSVCIVETDKVFSIKNVGLIKESENFLPKYLYYYLRSDLAKNYIKNNSSGSAQGFIGLTKLREFPIIITERKKQKKVIEVLTKIEERSNTYRQNQREKLILVQDLKNSILKKAFKGELIIERETV